MRKTERSRQDARGQGASRIAVSMPVMFASFTGNGPAGGICLLPCRKNDLPIACSLLQVPFYSGLRERRAAFPGNIPPLPYGGAIEHKRAAHGRPFWHALCKKALCGSAPHGAAFSQAAPADDTAPAGPLSAGNPDRPSAAGCPARRPKAGTARPDRKRSFWEERGSMRGRGGPFFKKVSSPPHQKYTASGQRWRASRARRPWP